MYGLYLTQSVIIPNSCSSTRKKYFHSVFNLGYFQKVTDCKDTGKKCQ